MIPGRRVRIAESVRAFAESCLQARLTDPDTTPADIQRHIRMIVSGPQFLDKIRQLKAVAVDPSHEPLARIAHTQLAALALLRTFKIEVSEYQASVLAQLIAQHFAQVDEDELHLRRIAAVQNHLHQYTEARLHRPDRLPRHAEFMQQADADVCAVIDAMRREDLPIRSTAAHIVAVTTWLLQSLRADREESLKGMSEYMRELESLLCARRF